MFSMNISHYFIFSQNVSVTRFSVVSSVFPIYISAKPHAVRSNKYCITVQVVRATRNWESLRPPSCNIGYHLSFYSPCAISTQYQSPWNWSFVNEKWKILTFSIHLFSYEKKYIGPWFWLCHFSFPDELPCMKFFSTLWRVDVLVENTCFHIKKSFLPFKN